MTSESDRIEALLRAIDPQADPDLVVRRRDEYLCWRANGIDAAALPQRRWQDDVIAELVTCGSSVLDLGCGDGELLARLIRERGVRGQGVELSFERVLRAIERGVPVIQGDVDVGLEGFADAGYDTVICEMTLQTLHRPREAVREMLRVGRRVVLTLPNFGHWRLRLDLALRGCMPSSDHWPHRWHATPNIHPCSYDDALELVRGIGGRVAGIQVWKHGRVAEPCCCDNLEAEEVLLVCVLNES